MSVDILFVSFNRLAYTRESFAALTANTDWGEVAGLYIADDASSDGTAEWLLGTNDAGVDMIPGGIEIHVNRGPFGGPVAATNWYLDHRSETADRVMKVDNDFVVCPGWLPELLRVMTINPGVDLLGVQPRFGPPTPAGDVTRTVDPCRHIGGIGMMRHRAFELCRPVPSGRYGFTEYQGEHPWISKAWVTPDLPCFSLDLIGAEPWRTLREEYIKYGWARRWPEYADGGAGYFDWWEPVDE